MPSTSTRTRFSSENQMTTENQSRLIGNLLTIKETKAALRVGHTKLYDLINAGQLEVVRFGKRCTRVKAESVDKLLQHGIA